MQVDTLTKVLNIPNQKAIEMIRNTEDQFEIILEPIEEAAG